MNKEKLIQDINKYLEENDIEFKPTEDNDMSDYGPEYDWIVAAVSSHGIILCDTGGEYYLQYVVSEKFGDKYITLVTDNNFESSVIESVEDLADEIIHNQNVFDNYILTIKEHG